MRGLPQSLFGRLVLVLAAGLVIAQLASAYLNYSERDRLLFRAGGARSAQRIADIANLLDTMSVEERRRVVAILNVPPLVVSLDRAPIDEARSAPATDEADEARNAFVTALRGALDKERPIRVGRGEWRPAWAPPHLRDGPREFAREQREAGAMRDGPPEKRRRPRGIFFLTQVALTDGTWVTFDALVPNPTVAPAWRLIASLSILLLAVLVLSWFAVRWVTRPLHTLAAAADALGRDIQRPPLPEAGPSEVKRAAHAFNTMQAKLVQLIADRGRVLAAMSHDLKTPLTRLRLRAELLEDTALRDKLERDLAEMEAMIAQTLDFLRGTEGHRESAPLDMVALLESLQTDYAETGRDVRVTPASAAPYQGDLRLLRRAITNLLDNAIRYGERARVSIEDSAEALVIRVADDGPGIPAAELEKVFEPFYRVEGSRSRETGGSGLGLAIARSIAQAHGGDIRLRNRAAGGLEATLTLGRG
jgi:signal transduction histidine kinase